ncbi:hypothetical protein L1887_48235 [Cichorium endivia]|nr:hypothetical protein L1887_48235 [Cichorium endivia]
MFPDMLEARAHGGEDLDHGCIALLPGGMVELHDASRQRIGRIHGPVPNDLPRSQRNDSHKERHTRQHEDEELHHLVPVLLVERLLLILGHQVPWIQGGALGGLDGLLGVHGGGVSALEFGVLHDERLRPALFAPLLEAVGTHVVRAALVGDKARVVGLAPLLDACELDAPARKVGVGGGEACVDLARIRQEGVRHIAWVDRLEDEPDGDALADLDVLLEHVRVVEHELDRGDGHDLGDGAKVEHGLLLEQGEVVECRGGVRHGIEQHGREHVHAATAELRVGGLVLATSRLGLDDAAGDVGLRGEARIVVGPALLGPEEAALLAVLCVVADDVGLLEEEAHVVGELELVTEPGPFELAFAKETREALADEAGDKVAVEVKVLPGADAQGGFAAELDVARHACAHLCGDVGDDGAVSLVEQLVLCNDLVELDEQLAVLFVGPGLGEVPSGLLEVLVEVDEERHLFVGGDGHVVLDGVERAEDEVEEADDARELALELLDDGGEGARGEVEEGPALSHALAIPAGLDRVGLDVVERVAPDLVSDHGAQLGRVGDAEQHILEQTHGERVCAGAKDGGSGPGCRRRRRAEKKENDRPSGRSGAIMCGESASLAWANEPAWRKRDRARVAPL